MTWKNDLPDDLKEAPSLKDVADVTSLAKQFVDLQTHLGSSIRIPSKEAGKEDMQKFYEKIVTHVPNLIIRPDMADDNAKETMFQMLGRPKEPKDYKLPDGSDESDFTKLLRDVAHKDGLNNSQFQSLISMVSGISKADQDKLKTSLQASQIEVEKEWGLKKDHNMKVVEGLLAATNAPEGLANAVKGGEATVTTLKWLLSLSEKLSGEGINFVKNQDSQNLPMTPSEARNRIIEIRANKQHPVWNKRDPMHQQAVTDWANLHKFSSAGK